LAAVPALVRNTVKKGCFNPDVVLPYELRQLDFQVAMQDVYDFMFDMNTTAIAKGLKRLDDMLRSQNLTGMLSDMLTASMAKHSRTLVENGYWNGHPDLLVEGRYANNSVQAGEDGVEIKSTVKRGGAVDHHGARDGWEAVFVYQTDRDEEKPASDRTPLTFTEVYINQLTVGDFRRNDRKSELGTRTATLDAAGIARFRENWVYLDHSLPLPTPANKGGATKRRRA
jgi:hypothetical protein